MLDDAGYFERVAYQFDLVTDRDVLRPGIDVVDDNVVSVLEQPAFVPDETIAERRLARRRSKVGGK